MLFITYKTSKNRNLSFVIFHKVTKKFVSLQTFATKFFNEKDTYNRRIGLHWLLYRGGSTAQGVWKLGR